MDKAALRHEVQSGLVLLEEKLHSFAGNAERGLHREAMSNLYYAAYDMACALLRSRGVLVESHDGAQSMLALHFEKSGALPKGTTKKLNTLMQERHAADYKGHVAFTAGDVAGQHVWVADYLRRGLALLQEGAVRLDLGPVRAALAGFEAAKIGERRATVPRPRRKR